MLSFRKFSFLRNNRIIIAAVCLMLATVIALSAVQPLFKADAATSIMPRCQPAYSTESSYAYYTTKNIYYNCGYGMPNCTCYAYGRVYEMLDKEPNLCHYDAEEWYDYNKEHGYYSYGKTPKIGAVACWDCGDSGHVAIVEAIVGDKIIMSQSAYGYLNFYLSVEDYDNPGQSGWTFQGYIYPGEFTSKGFGGELYRSVDYTGSINFRSGPGTNYSVLDTIDYHMGFVVTEKVESGGYTWGKTTYLGRTGYIALTDDVQFLLKSGTSPEPTPTAPATTETATTSPPYREVNEFYAITSDDGVNMRSGAGTSNSKIGFIPYYAQINVKKIQEAGGYTWGYTTYNNKTGWCVLDYSEQLFGLSADSALLDFYISNTSQIGDVNGDNRLTITDATLVQLYLSEFIRFSKGSLNNADTDKSGSIGISDATKIQMVLARLDNF